ncbi:18715_t:CDS:1, partial [Gigaspora margarita]
MLQRLFTPLYNHFTNIKHSLFASRDKKEFWKTSAKNKRKEEIQGRSSEVSKALLAEKEI